MTSAEQCHAAVRPAMRCADASVCLLHRAGNSRARRNCPRSLRSQMVGRCSGSSRHPRWYPLAPSNHRHSDVAECCMIRAETHCLAVEQVDRATSSAVAAVVRPEVEIPPRSAGARTGRSTADSTPVATSVGATHFSTTATASRFLLTDDDDENTHRSSLPFLEAASSAGPRQQRAQL